jgi:hypothetical protein
LPMERERDLEGLRWNKRPRRVGRHADMPLTQSWPEAVVL